MKKLGIHTSFQFVYLFTICKTCTLVPESILESVLEFVLESEYQALELLDFHPIIAYNSSNISCFSGKCAVCLLIFVPHEPWHSKLPRFDPAYLHQKVVNSTRIHDFFFIFCKKVVVVKFKKHSRPPFRPLVFHLKIKYSRGGISWLVYFLCFHWFFVFRRLCIREPWKTAHTQIGPCNPFCRLDYWQTCFPGVQYT